MWQPVRHFAAVVAHRGRRFLLPALVTALLLPAIWSWWSEGVIHEMLRTDVSATDRVETLRGFFARFGAAGPLVYLGLVTVEVVVAPLPGLMLYAPGGILFGTFIGGGMALVGNILGAGIACAIARALGGTWLDGYFPVARLERINREVDRRGPLLIFLLRINPLTSSDIVSYAAGLTQIRIWKVMAATGLAMVPLCFAQAWLAEGLLDAFPELIYPLLVCCIGYLFAVLAVVRKMIVRPDDRDS